MRQTKLDSVKSPWAALAGSAAAAILLGTLCPARAMAQPKGQRTFATPEAAGSALVKAAEDNDQVAMVDILGPSGRQLVSSGDETEDAQNRANFVEKYNEMHRLVAEPDGTTILYIGARNWPTPIPLVHKGHSWYFDTDAAKKEILFRRIGQNEASTILVCKELAAAQEEYRSSQGGHYAEAILSDPGKHNGLFWKVADGEPRSPVGPLVAWAEIKSGGESLEGTPAPYRGYFYRTLAGQGKHAPGGARSFTGNGAMTQGFAFVSFPAKYQSSGVMTFIVNQDGVVYQKDLGKKTPELAGAMSAYDPDRSWVRAEGQ